MKHPTQGSNWLTKTSMNLEEHRAYGLCRQVFIKYNVECIPLVVSGSELQQCLG